MEVKGLKNLKAKLKRLQPSPADLAVVVEVGAKPIENDAKERAPYEFGQLKRDIHTEVKTSSTGATATIGNSKLVPYATYQEYGTLNEDGTQKVPAKAYLRGALSSQQGRAIKDMSAAVSALIKKRTKGT